MNLAFLLMSENQNIEYKQSWHDEYLKWICGFANAQGGTLFIGKDDKGKIVGLADGKKLIEDIPNKVKDILGIMVDVNLHQAQEGDFIEIIVEAYPFPVNYKGQFHYRSGSTKQELKGLALDKYLLQRNGKRWDGVPVPKVTATDLKHETFDFFRKRALKSKRIEDEVLNDTDELLLENLQLIESGYLKRAAILLFHPKPEKFVTGAFVKIGKFTTDDDLRFQDEVNGNLFEQVEKTMDLLFTKYIKADISYEGIARVETYEYPKDAVREALLNAVAHKDYSGATPIQISAYDDKIIFWNEGQLPENWTVESLLSKHPTRPYNPDIANAFFRCGFIELWGRGTLKIIKECELAGLPKPVYQYSMSGIFVEFRRDIYNDASLTNIGLNPRQVKAVLHAKMNGLITNKIYQEINSVSKRTASNDLTELVEKFKLLIKTGVYGAGISYEIIGQKRQ
jgi:ATP-dependent DNA helicase RecG